MLPQTDNQQTGALLQDLIWHIFKVQQLAKVVEGDGPLWPRTARAFWRTRDGPSLRFSTFLIQNFNIPILVVNINHIPISVELLPCEVHHQNTSLRCLTSAIFRIPLAGCLAASCFYLLTLNKGPDQCEGLFSPK